MSSKSTSLKVPTWITLKEVPGEFLGVAAEIVAELGELVGSDKDNTYNSDQRFCVSLKSREGYRIQVAIKNESTVLFQKSIDYGNLSIRCRYYLALDYLVKDYPSIIEK